MTKKEKIKEEYGEYWDLVKDHIDENGYVVRWLGAKFVISEMDKKIDLEYKLDTVRPKSLRGIDDNNGWKRIEDDIFPEDTETVLWLNNDNYEWEMASLCHVDFDYRQYTHWQNVFPKSPLF